MVSSEWFGCWVVFTFYTGSTACSFGLRQPPPEESVSWQIENAIVRDVVARSRRVSILMWRTVSIIAVRRVRIITRVVRSVLARGVSVRIPSNLGY